jgi:hypothetical protein
MMRLFPAEPCASKRSVRIAWGVVLILVFMLAAWLIATLLRQSDQIRETQAVNQAQDSALAEANRRLIEAGERPVPTPSPGPAGEPGSVGPSGPPGPRGPAGPRGLLGTQGARGLQGIRGALGEEGAEGATGATGAQGPKGETGATGVTGPQGPAGPAGADGTDGTNGADGKDGASPFPFTFRFTVQNNPAQSTTYTVTCTADGCTVSESDNAQS